MKVASFLVKAVIEQRQWIKEHGASLQGYIEKYHVEYGRSVGEAEAIYQADLDVLQSFERRLERVTSYSGGQYARHQRAE